MQEQTEAGEQIEPGVLPVFRLFVGVTWLIFSLAFVALLRPGVTPNYVGLLSWWPTTALLIYLVWPALRRLFGRAYLPIALVVASASPIVVQAIAVTLYLRRGVAPAAIPVEPSGLYVWLLIPLLLLSAQYGYRAVIAFTVGTSALSALLALPFVGVGAIGLATLTNAAIRLGLFTLAGSVVVRLSKAQRALRDELARKNIQLASYAVTLEHLTVSRERNRLARELHDTLAHTLSALSVQLTALEVQLDGETLAARRTLRQAQDLTRNGLDEARRALLALRATPVEALGLLPAIRRAAEQAAERAGLKLQLSIPEHLGPLSPDVEQHLFRIADEALQNVTRHARARELALALCQRTGELTLTIRDNGVGFDPALPPAEGHYGLSGMRERAALIDAAIEIRSLPQQGTTVELRIPRR